MVIRTLTSQRGVLTRATWVMTAVGVDGTVPDSLLKSSAADIHDEERHGSFCEVTSSCNCTCTYNHIIE